MSLKLRIKNLKCNSKIKKLIRQKRGLNSEIKKRIIKGHKMKKIDDIKEF
jgi:hypothetical protein